MTIGLEPMAPGEPLASLETAVPIHDPEEIASGGSSPIVHQRTLQSLALLAGAGASVGLFIGSVQARVGFDAFTMANEGGRAYRTALSAWLFGGALVPVLFAVLLLIRRRHEDSAWLARTADLAAPLLVTGLLPILFSWRRWAEDPLPYLVTLTIAGLGLEWALSRFFRALPEEVFDGTSLWSTTSRAAQRVPLVAVLCGAVFYTVYISYFTILNHHRLGTAGFDLGINVNWCWNALHGQLWRCPVLFGTNGGHFIGNHAIFAMLYWLPIFALKPGAEVLLIWQAFIVAFAAVPLYFFARTQLPAMAAGIIALLYLFYAPLHGPNFYDYHELLPAIFWHFALYWAIAKRRYRWLWLLVPIVYSHREDVAVGVAVLGAFLALSGIRVRLGSILAVVSVVWFVLIKFVIMPRLWSTWFANIYKDLHAPGDHSYGSVVQTILINPAYFLKTLLKEIKAVYFLHLFAPLLLLPARRPALLLLAIPGFFFSMMTTGYGPTISISFQYTTHWVPYLFAASVLMLASYGIGREARIRRASALGAMTLTMVAHSFAFGAFFQHETFIGGFSHIQFKITPQEKQRYEDLKAIIAKIPPEASVGATENEVPHLATRMDAYTLLYGHGEAEYMVINGPRLGLGGTRANIDEALSLNQYALVERRGDIYLFKRGSTTPESRDAFKALGLNPDTYGTRHAP